MANTKKRVLSLLMALVMTLGLLPISALADETPVVDPIPQTEEAQPTEQEPAQEEPAQAESAPQEPTNQQTPSAPAGSDTSTAKEYKRTLWIQLEEDGEWLYRKEVAFKIYNSEGIQIHQGDTTTGKKGSGSGGGIKLTFSSFTEPKSVEVTYKDGKKEYTTGMVTLEGKETTLTLNRVRASGISKADQKLLDQEGNPRVTFDIFRLYENKVPDNINKSFNNGLFGPKGDNTPYFRITVDMAKLLAKEHMETTWKNNNWYVSLDTCKGLGTDNAARLQAFWANVLDCTTDGKDNFNTFFAGEYAGYVLKREGEQGAGGYHIDGVVTLDPPVYTTELYLGGQIVASKSDSFAEEEGKTPGQPYSYVTGEYESLLDQLHPNNQGSMDWTKTKPVYTTADGDQYEFTKGEWPANEDGETIHYSPVADDKDIQIARFYLTGPTKLTHTYTVKSIYNYVKDGAPSEVGTQSVTRNALTDPGEASIIAETAAGADYTTTELGKLHYDRTTVVRSGDNFDSDQVVYTVTYQHTAATYSYQIDYALFYQLDDGPMISAGIKSNVKKVTVSTKPDGAAVLAQADPSVNYSSTVAGVPEGAHDYNVTTDASKVEFVNDFESNTMVATVPYLYQVTRVSHTYTINTIYKYKLDGGEYKEVKAEIAVGGTISAKEVPTSDQILEKTGGSPVNFKSDESYVNGGTPIGLKSYTGTVTNNGATFDTDELVYTVTYTCDDKTAAHTYNVQYEFYYKANGVEKYTEMGLGEVQIKPAVQFAPNEQAVWEAATTAAVLHTTDGVNHTYKKAASFQADDVETTGKLGKDLLYTVKFYCEEYTVGKLTINKTIKGLSDAALETLKEDLKFTITYPNETTVVEVAFSKFDKSGSNTGKYTYTTALDLHPGQYTVTETGYEVPGYTLPENTVKTVTKSVAGSATPTDFNFTNTYESQTYKIIFQAGDHGVLTAGKTGTGNEMVYTLHEYTQEGKPSTWDWIYSGAAETLSNKKIVYQFTYDDYAAKHVTTLPDQSITPDPGYTWTNGKFTEVGGKQATYNDMATTMDALLASGETSITYTAAPYTAKDDEYTVKYMYQKIDGSYIGADVETSALRTGKTGDEVTVTEADKEERTHADLRYVFDDTNTSNRLKDTLNGNNTTTLDVYFKWQAGVTYKYVAAEGGKLPSDKILKDHPLPTNETPYYFGDTVTNEGTAATDTSDPAGTWNLTWVSGKVPMTADGVTFVGTWTFVPVGQAVVKVQFVDQAGNPLTVPGYSTTAKIGTDYDFTAAESVKIITQSPYTYDFVGDYQGEFVIGKGDETVTAYEGTIPASGLTITRVYQVRTTNVVLEKTYTGINALPADFTITVRDSKGTVKATLTLADVKHTADGMVGFITTLPLGETYTFTESGYSNGAGWSTVLTAQQAEGQRATPRMVLPDGYTMKDLAVNGYSFTATVTTNDLVGGDGVMIAMHNAYTYTAPIDPQPIPPIEPDNDEGYGPGENPLENIVTPEVPLADLPETEIPLTELPETEVPLAEAPATGDNLAMWIMAAAISGLSLVWLMISGKKREDENAE